MQTVYPAYKELQLLAVKGLINRVASEIYMQLYRAVSFSVGTLKGSLLSKLVLKKKKTMDVLVPRMYCYFSIQTQLWINGLINT